MIILIGLSGSGKTKYFLEKHPDSRILHADNLKLLRSSIQSVNSMLIEKKPTLINTWFDLNVSDILDLHNYNVYVETHYFETDAVKTVNTSNSKRYWGVYNENKLRLINKDSVLYFTPPENRNIKKNVNLMELFGTRYNWIKSQIPEVFE